MSLENCSTVSDSQYGPVPHRVFVCQLRTRAPSRRHVQDQTPQSDCAGVLHWQHHSHRYPTSTFAYTHLTDPALHTATRIISLWDWGHIVMLEKQFGSNLIPQGILHKRDVSSKFHCIPSQAPRSVTKASLILCLAVFIVLILSCFLSPHPPTMQVQMCRMWPQLLRRSTLYCSSVGNHSNSRLIPVRKHLIFGFQILDLIWTWTRPQTLDF